MDFDLIIIGSGPGGYVAAIRASQLGLKTALIEMAEPGGVCLNWGCIPTKALLKSAQVYEYIKHSSLYGIKTDEKVIPDLEAIVERSRQVANNMSKGVTYLIKKNNITFIKGKAKICPGKKVEITNGIETTQTINANNIIIATGARAKQLSNIPIDGNKIISYRDALTLKKKPNSILIIGSGAIGCEFAYFYNSLGTKVTIIEFMPNIIPLEDEEISKHLARSFKKAGIKIMLSSLVTNIDKNNELCKVNVKTSSGEEVIIETELVLSAIGIKSNIENIGLEDVGIKTENDKIIVDKFYKTNIEGYYAIGDVIPGPALAHVASHEGIICVEAIAGKDPEPLNYNNIPACIYTQPEIASVGLTEKAAIDKGYTIKIGKFPLTASGKAHALGETDGFIKIIFDAETNNCLGAHIIGNSATEIIGGLVMSRKLNIKAQQIIKTIFPHPTISESLMEAAAIAYGEAINI
ncbi:MAG TPA: dihydrolipoyl dehydrogenase [Bacteroidales bacterium]|nr:dihydrolipoyl dehydrogenase [Bacteroidales bacterium]